MKILQVIEKKNYLTNNLKKKSKKKKNCVKRLSTNKPGSMDLLLTLKFAFYRKNRICLFKNVAKKATFRFSGVSDVSKCCQKGNKYGKSVENVQ